VSELAKVFQIQRIHVSYQSGADQKYYHYFYDPDKNDPDFFKNCKNFVNSYRKRLRLTLGLAAWPDG
jgi:hypothetical protein